MKVVLFCGGLGTRLREYTGEIPKPMVKIGYRPILWQEFRARRAAGDYADHGEYAQISDYRR